ncbi:MAG: DEAD/DEAH box helicase family protein [Geminicoccaceae bacterium]
MRPYQEEAIAAILAARERGVRRQLLVLPTGAGKTIVFAELIRRLRAEEGAASCAR